MESRMFIEYMITPDFLIYGDFENIPEDAYGAHITISFPIVCSDGELGCAFKAYNLYVGHRTDDGNFVTTQFGSFQFNYGDAVFDTKEQMNLMITKIHETFEELTAPMEATKNTSVYK